MALTIINLHVLGCRNRDRPINISKQWWHRRTLRSETVGLLQYFPMIAKYVGIDGHLHASINSHANLCEQRTYLTYYVDIFESFFRFIQNELYWLTLSNFKLYSTKPLKPEHSRKKVPKSGNTLRGKTLQCPMDLINSIPYIYLHYINCIVKMGHFGSFQWKRADISGWSLGQKVNFWNILK